MLSEREKKVRDVLVEMLAREQPWSKAGLGGLSYAERKHLLEDLDPDFVEKQLAKVRRSERWARKAMYASLAMMILVPLVLMGIDQWVGLGDDEGLWLFLAVILGLSVIPLFTEMRNRLHVYRALAALCDLADEEAGEEPGALAEHKAADETWLTAGELDRRRYAEHGRTDR